MFALRQIVRNTRVVVPGFRALSSGSLVDVAVDNEGIAIVTMQRLPVNSLNLELLQDLNKALDDVKKNKWKGMILTSASPNVFSAGLDLMELYKPDMKRIETFWTTLREVWIKLFGSNFITAAAVNGHAVAAACLLAMSCEYRVMVNGKYTMGYNEANFGIVVFQLLINTMTYTISQRQAELAIATGKMFSADEAKEVGLIDEAAENKTEAIEKCKQFIKKFDKIPPLARAITKQRIREEPLMWIQKNGAQETKEFIEYFTNPNTQEMIGSYLQSLKQRKESAKK